MLKSAGSQNIIKAYNYFWETCTTKCRVNAEIAVPGQGPRGTQEWLTIAREKILPREESEPYPKKQLEYGGQLMLESGSQNINKE